MSESFAGLVERLAERLVAPPRVVTPEEYRAITCNRCGVCCEDIRAPHAPNELAALAAHPDTEPDRRKFFSGLEPVGPVPGGWQYRCRHFRRDAEGLGLCGIYETRPAICSGFPYGKVVRQWIRCAWYVQIRDTDGPVLPLMPAADQRLAASSGAAAGPDAGAGE